MKAFENLMDYFDEKNWVSPSTLYMVGTPIGNLSDISIRALQVLSQVDYIYCEDTRHSQILLQHYHIRTRLSPLHAHNQNNQSFKVIQQLKKGLAIAYISDAGTPGVSDPGSVLVEHVLGAQLNVVPIPGACSLVSLWSVAGILPKNIVFLGFLRRKGEKQWDYIKQLLTQGNSIAIMESPHRMEKLFSNLQKLEFSITIVLGKELTKKFEMVWKGLLTDFEKHCPQTKWVGEWILFIYKT